ncbi:hypothetical protein WDU99_09970 [Microbacterium sp. Mu-80]|uniref:Preprotein translocase YidC n=1 Tax=Microbacterium bandirmense TaxID=3122050 RepID=A0ABU8LBW7_9MICO
MSGIDEGMMPEHVQPQHPDDDTVDESIVRPHTGDDAEDDDGGRRADDEGDDPDHADGAGDQSSATGA